jgi:hypothetical protein
VCEGCKRRCLGSGQEIGHTKDSRKDGHISPAKEGGRCTHREKERSGEGGLTPAHRLKRAALIKEQDTQAESVSSRTCRLLWLAIRACSLQHAFLDIQDRVHVYMYRFGTVFSSCRQPVVCVAFTGRMLAARAGPLSVKPLHTSFITFYICMISNSGVSHLRHIHIPGP